MIVMDSKDFMCLWSKASVMGVIWEQLQKIAGIA
jgi:hypothetical protein